MSRNFEKLFIIYKTDVFYLNIIDKIYLVCYNYSVYAHVAQAPLLHLKKRRKELQEIA